MRDRIMNVRVPPRAGWRARVARDEVRRNAVLSLALAGGAAALSFGMLLVLARAMGKTEFGLFAFWFSLASFVTVVAGRGGEMFILRSWSEYVHAGRPDLARGALLFGLARAGVGALAAVAICVPVALTASLSTGLVAGLAGFVLAQTVSLYTSQAARAVVGIAAGVVHREMTWRLLVIGVAGGTLLTGDRFTIERFLFVAVSGIALAAVLQAGAVWRRLPRAVRHSPPTPPDPDWPRRCRRIWAGGILEASSQHLDTVIVGLVLSPEAAGVYFMAMRLAGAFLMIGDALVLYTSRMIPDLYFQGRRGDVASLLARTSGLAAVLVLLGFSVVALGGDRVLAAFGTAFADHHDILLILCLGTAATTLAGPAPSLLILTGNEGLYATAVAAGLAVRVVLFAMLAWAGALWGAAVATALALIGLAIVLNVLSRRRTGIDPSILGLFRATDKLNGSPTFDRSANGE